MAIYTLPTKDGMIQKCYENNPPDAYERVMKVAPEVVRHMDQILTRVKLLMEET